MFRIRHQIVPTKCISGFNLQLCSTGGCVSERDFTLAQTWGPFVETFESRKYAIASRRKEKKYTVVVFGELPFTRLYGQDVSHLESSTHGEEVPVPGCDCAQQHKSIEASSARLAARAAAARLPQRRGRCSISAVSEPRVSPVSGCDCALLLSAIALKRRPPDSPHVWAAARLPR